jgi:hypothetical protein
LHDKIVEGVGAYCHVVGYLVVHFIAVLDVEVGTADVPYDVVGNSRPMRAMDCQSTMMAELNSVAREETVWTIPRLVKMETILP